MKVFVYGTLKKGYGANYKLESGEYLGEAVSLDTFVIKGSGFPLAFLSSSGHPLRGELYDIHPSVQPALDAYEGYPHFYTRDLTFFRDANGSSHEAWMYHIPADQLDSYTGPCLKPGEDGVLEWQRE